MWGGPEPPPGPAGLLTPKVGGGGVSGPLTQVSWQPLLPSSVVAPRPLCGRASPPLWSSLASSVVAPRLLCGRASPPLWSSRAPCDFAHFGLFSVLMGATCVRGTRNPPSRTRGVLSTRGVLGTRGVNNPEGPGEGFRATSHPPHIYRVIGMDKAF